MSSGSKIKILSDSDLEELYALPILDDEVRKELFCDKLYQTKVMGELRFFYP